jgi:flagellar biosynthesis protein FlhG
MIPENWDFKQWEGYMRKRSVAVGSGKGGVGKTTTAVNLAIYYARQGYATALIDLDPLSNAATLLDVEDGFDDKGLDPEASLDAFILPIFDNLDLLFPGKKTGPQDSRIIRELIFETFAAALTSAYDLLIFDLPAGLDEEENLAFLPHLDNLIVVTNPEPTAHVAAGAYIKSALAKAPDINLYVWHNRFSPPRGGGIVSRDVIGTYNRNMPAEERLDEKLKESIQGIAFVPDDPSLDLLQGTPSAIMNIHRSLLSVVGQLIEERTELLVRPLPFSKGIRRLLSFYLSGSRQEKEEDFLAGFGEYVSGLLSSAFNRESAGTEAFTEKERSLLAECFRLVRKDPSLLHMRRVRTLLEAKIEALEDETKLFSKGVHIDHDRNIDRETGLLLRSIQQSANVKQLRPNAAVLLFYFSLYKLLQSPTIVRLLNDFIPFREGSRGEPIRDRRSQITNLIHRSEEYNRRYFGLIKTIFPVVGKQIEAVSSAFGLHSLLLRDPESRKVRSDLYAKLLSNFIHDTLYSGLSVVVGFEYRSAAISFQQGADFLGEALLPSKQKSA